MSGQKFFLAMLLIGLVGGISDSGVSSLANDDPDLFQATRILDVQIKLSDADWRELRAQQPNPAAFTGGDASETNYTYFRGDLWIDGQTVENVGIRKKGFFGSNDGTRPSLKVKLDEYQKQQPWPEIDLLTLNNNKQDQALLSQFLAYHVFRLAGVPAPRCNFARVTVNGKYLGVYTHVESIKKPFLKREFGHSNGPLYEGALADFHPIGYLNIEAKNKAAEDRSRLKALTDLLAQPGDLPLDRLQKLVDVDHFLMYWAVESLLGFWDGYTANQNNYYLYFPPSEGPARFIPWGADWVFTTTGPFAFFGPPPSIVYAQSQLANRLYRTPGIPPRYERAMMDVLQTAWHEDELLATVDQMEELLTPHLGPSQQDVPQVMNDLRKFIRERRAFAMSQLASGPLPVPPQPRSPAYQIPVGSLAGEFTTNWGAVPPGQPHGQANLDIQLNDQKVEPTEIQVQIGDFVPPRGGFAGGPFPGPPSNVELVQFSMSISRADDRPLIVNLSFPKDQLVAGQSVQVSGQLMTIARPGGRPGPPAAGPPAFGPGPPGGAPNRSVTGTIVFREVAPRADAAVTGTLKLEVNEMRGGLFGGGLAPPPGGPPAPPPGRSSFGQRPGGP